MNDNSYSSLLSLKNELSEKKGKHNQQILAFANHITPGTSRGRWITNRYFSEPDTPTKVTHPELREALYVDAKNGNPGFNDSVHSLIPPELAVALAQRDEIQKNLDEIEKRLNGSQEDEVTGPEPQPADRPNPTTRRRAVWLGAPGEFAELVGILRDGGWVDPGEDKEDFFETLADCFTIKAKPSIKPHALCQAFNRAFDGSKRKKSVFEPLRKIKRL